MKPKTLVLTVLLLPALLGMAQAQQPGAAPPAATLTAAAREALVGSWHGPVAVGNATLTFVVKIKTDEQGVLQGSLTVPEEGPTQLPLLDIRFDGKRLTFSIAAVMGDYAATLTEGKLDGVWHQSNPPGPPEGLPVVLKRGEYVAPVYALKLSDESFGALAGSWTGTLEADGPQGKVTLPLVLRFETDKQGNRVAFMDSISQHAVGLPVTEASLTNGKLSIRVEVVQGEYHATLNGSSMSGDWNQGPASLPLTMTRK